MTDWQTKQIVEMLLYLKIWLIIVILNKSFLFWWQICSWQFVPMIVELETVEDSHIASMNYEHDNKMLQKPNCILL